MAERVATIDLGSNSCVLLVLERRSDGVHVVDSRLQITRLSQGLDQDKTLASDAIDRSVKALREFAAHAQELGAETISAVGTAALREASNAGRVIDQAAQFGLTLRAISGEAEAALSFASLFDGTSKDAALMIDVGGASTEFAWGRQGQLEGRVSLPIGSVRLHENLAVAVPARPTELTRVRQAIDDALRTLPPLVNWPVYAVAGTATTAAQMHLGLMDYVRERVDGVELSGADLSHLIGKLAPLAAAERRARFGLPEGRADVLPVGLCILERSLLALGARPLVVRDRGVAWGEALRLLE